MNSKNRGMLLEQIINQTLSYYFENNIAYIEKKNLPIKFFKVDNRTLKDAFIYKKSTVDYIGCFKGKFVAFEAKTTNLPKLPKNNILQHQWNYLLNIDKNGGLAFFIILFSFCDEFYLISARKLSEIIGTSVSYEHIKKIGFKIELTFPGIIDFLPYLNKIN
ncbi:Holliday junction resolvase RecU [Mycoplasmopsis lipofaciens]|uniref:Holliday junction resolvase RecU n=1 Tax=Mycoplasmopsis lipofaciens TaxID=114884 RepID=UPI0004851994|nr:Holliday junction resolvase RecU [Mycoplasmopsis lipofaciens]